MAMRYFLMVILAMSFLVGSASAQMPLLLERELLPLSKSVLAGGGLGSSEKCGKYLMYSDIDSKVPFIIFEAKRLPSDKPNLLLIVVIQKRNVHPVIDGTKKIPTVKLVPGTGLVLRLNQRDYGESLCLPAPVPVPQKKLVP